MIVARDLYVSYGKKPVVKGACLEARAGELTAIIGPNGSGKTSLLRALSGEVKYQGSANLNAMEVNRTSAPLMATHRGVLPQFSNVSFPFTVGEIVRMGMTIGYSGSDNFKAADRVLQALDKVGLSEFVGRKYQELSGGEQQRVQFARVLSQVWEPVFEGVPRWLFLDEPISSLDIQHQLTIMNLSREFSQSGGGVISILHDLNLTAMYADQIILMRDGQIMRAGEPSYVLQDSILETAFGCALRVGKTPPAGQQFVLPQSVAI
ncbi:MAG: heme ABC transporter ATP-binding protein [Pseudomonadota bacterium]